MRDTIYICLFEPEGDLRYDTCVNVNAIFSSKEKAKEFILKKVEEDIANNEYVVDEQDLQNFKSGENMWINVFYQDIENYRWYYTMSILEREVEY